MIKESALSKKTLFHSISPHSDVPLVVDIDGTLIHTDLLFEAIALLIRKNPGYLFLCLVWALKGKTYCKNRIFERVGIDFLLLPYNRELLGFINDEFERGRKIVLASASPIAAVMGVSKACPFFSEIYGTDSKINLKGKNKMQLLVARFGHGKFDYVGNGKSDAVIFAASRFAYLVNPSKSVERNTNNLGNLRGTIHTPTTTVKEYLQAIRVHQWIKNLLIFVPLVTGHYFYSVPRLAITFAAFSTFCLVASAGYLLNDILDVTADRHHPQKKYRAVASGKISIVTASIISLVFLTAGLFFASKLGLRFLGILSLYFGISLAYSIFLKRIALYDVFILALLYSIRIFAGGEVIAIPISFWLIGFSTFLFLSLAFLKRYSELVVIKDIATLKKQSRGYIAEDNTFIQIMGIASGFVAIVVFSLYINSLEVKELYNKYQLLWFIGFLLMFWINRMWMLTSKGKMTDDPIVFTLKDPASYVLILLCGGLLLAAL